MKKKTLNVNIETLSICPPMFLPTYLPTYLYQSVTVRGIHTDHFTLGNSISVVQVMFRLGR